MENKSISELLGPLFKEGLCAESMRKLLEEKDVLCSFDRERIRSWEQEFAFWEEYGKIYVNLEKAGPYRNLTKTIEELTNPKPNEAWLDVGCGPAKMSLVIWKKSYRSVRLIVGLDIVLDPARKTHLSFPEMPLKLVFAHLGEELPFSDGYFDGIVANLVLPYVTDFRGKRGKQALRSILKEMYRVLKPGGHMVWSTPKENVHFQWVFIASIPDMINPVPYIKNGDLTRITQGTRILRHALEIQRKGREGIYSFLSIPEIEQILEEIGFVNPIWKLTFARQVLVNRVYKPD